MPKDDENISLFSDLSSQPTKPQGFAPGQMLRCEGCLRANPPTRSECLYCGHALPVSDATAGLARPSLRPLEKWEQGHNSILMKSPAAGLSDKAMDQAAGLLRLKVDDLKQIILAPRPLPLARTATDAEAVIIGKSLSALGLETMIVSDQTLAVEASPPRRLRALELRDTSLLAYQVSASAGTLIAWNAITLVMTGRLSAKRVEFRERKRRGSENEIVDASETATDEAVLDFYTKNQDGGWRIMANNFDFSCLGDRKTLLASENFSTLLSVIRDHAANAEHDNSYNSLRRILELVWPSGQQTAPRGWHRDRAGKYTSEVTMTNNEPQFTRYSRLCHFLRCRSVD